MKRAAQLLPMALIFVFTSTLFLGCDTAPTESGTPSKVEGYVTDRDGSTGLSKRADGIEGATVTLVRLKSNGDYQTVSESEVTTDAQGHFVVETDIDNESHLIVVAEKGANTWRSMVTNSVENESTIRSAPLTTETTVEVDVLAKLVGETGDEFSRARAAAETQNAINAEVAVESHLFQNAYAELTDVIVNRMRAKSESFFADSSEAPSTAELNAAWDAHTEAQINLENQLFSANGASASINSAYESYNDAWLNAYINAGVNAGLYAKAEQIGTWISIQSSTALPGEAEFAFSQKAAVHKAKAFAHAMQVEFNALVDAGGATNANIDAVVNAGNTMVSSVKSANSMSDVSTAFSSYHDVVIAELAAAVDVNTGVTSDEVNTVDANINSGAKGTLTTTIRSAFGTIGFISTIVNAYGTFYSAVDTSVRNNLTNLTLGQYEPVLSIMVLANIVVD